MWALKAQTDDYGLHSSGFSLLLIIAAISGGDDDEEEYKDREE